MNRMYRGAVLLAVLAATGCGGGGGGGSTATTTPPVNTASPPGNASGVTYAAGVYPAYATLANQCTSAAAQNNFLRSWTNDTYLWYSEVPDLDPNRTPDPLDYFDLLKTPLMTASMKPKDRFHFTYDTTAWNALSQSGVAAGYGVQWVVVASSPPRLIVAAYIEPDSPAAAAGITRGTQVLRVDDEDVVQGGATQAAVDVLNAGLFPDEVNKTHTFRIRNLDGSESTVSMTSEELTLTPVQNVHTIDDAGARVGYILFNDHIATSEALLVDAITQLRDADIDDLVLDIRYNGGGYLVIAAALAYMIAGNDATDGRIFERLQFNDKHPTIDPITNEPLTSTPFQKIGHFGAANGVALPTLDLPRVYVLTGPNTCSASESIINGLRGVGVTVYQIGAATCGKPYGFYPQDNCGTTYFSIQFQGDNDLGFGDYADGFTPASIDDREARVLGCEVADDFTHPLGDVAEARLRAALAFRAADNQPAACAIAASAAPRALSQTGPRLSAADGLMPKSPARENRLMMPGPGR